MPKIPPIAKPYTIHPKTRILKYHPKKDVLQNELKQLAKKYKKTFSIEDKKLIIEKEREILYQEIEDPLLTVARNQKNTSWKMPENINDVLLANIRALRNIEVLRKPFLTTITQNKISILAALSLALYQHAPENEIERAYVESILNQLPDTTVNQALGIEEDFDEGINIDLNTVDINDITPDDFWAIVTSPNKSNEEIKDFIKKTLKTEGLSKEITEYAIAIAGYEKSDEAFVSLKDIALNPVKDNCYRQKELALHSIARYIREKEDEVKQILEDVQKNDEFYSPLAEILLAKCNGKYHGVKNQNELFEQYVKTDGEINTQQKNLINRVLKKLEWIIPSLIKNNFELNVSKDTYTKFEPQAIGTRGPDGSFMDAVQFTAFKNKSMLSPELINGKDEDSMLLRIIEPQINAITNLQEFFRNNYLKALQEDSAPNIYAQQNLDTFTMETIAAMNCYYVPLEKAFEENPGMATSIYKLRDVNPELYEYSKNIIDGFKAIINSDN